MAFLQINNIRIAGFSDGVPVTVVRNDDSNIYSADYDAAAFVEMTGLREYRVDKVSCTSDLSSASIPLTIVTQLKNKIENKPTKLLCCGFGVGLSWGTVALETKNIIISDLIEI